MEVERSGKLWSNNRWFNWSYAEYMNVIFGTSLRMKWNEMKWNDTKRSNNEMKA
jgi:hypothetical protein